MNILNKGRCYRCIASKVEPYEYKKYKEEKIIFTEIRSWLFCDKYKKFCISVAGLLCKEPPMGMSAIDYLRVAKGNRDGQGIKT